MKRPRTVSTDDHDATVSPAKRPPTSKSEISSANNFANDGITSMQIGNLESVGASTSSSSSDEDDDSGTSSQTQNVSSTAAGAPSILLVPKERPTTLDMVVKNVEALFRLLKK